MGRLTVHQSVLCGCKTCGLMDGSMGGPGRRRCGRALHARPSRWGSLWDGNNPMCV